ncbi:MAG: hypothetical protein RR101_13665, partial [Burkholderiaceae bacterium]
RQDEDVDKARAEARIKSRLMITAINPDTGAGANRNGFDPTSAVLRRHPTLRALNREPVLPDANPSHGLRCNRADSIKPDL